jgi:hypothetical protein
MYRGALEDRNAFSHLEPSSTDDIEERTVNETEPQQGGPKILIGPTNQKINDLKLFW